MKDTIFYVGGGKGGVGKSMVSLTLIQFLIDKYGEQKTIHLIETDESNPDVGRVYKNKIPVTTAILDEDEKDWIRMAGVMENTSDTLFVINSAARSILGVRKHGRDFNSVLESGKINYDLVTLWPLNRQKDSVLLLEDFLEYISFGHIFPIRNCYFGEPEDFALYEKYLSDKHSLDARILETFNFPALADIIADDFYTGGKTIPETATSLGAFAGQSFLSWRNRVYKMFDEICELSVNTEPDGDEAI
ncbi:hypothetical protein FACS1894216_20690 [Synergistales bacterium]|nr:hypothetical protein FACS1894216_20690 [Synergistales bacterium]